MSHNASEPAAPSLPNLLTTPCGDDEAALAACEKAAEHGVLAAQLMLARAAMARGQNDHNPARAYLWLSMAVDQLTQFRNAAKKTMTSAQVTEAERELRQRIEKMHLVEQPISAHRSSVCDSRPVARIS